LKGAIGINGGIDALAAPRRANSVWPPARHSAVRPPVD